MLLCHVTIGCMLTFTGCATFHKNDFAKLITTTYADELNAYNANKNNNKQT